MKPILFTFAFAATLAAQNFIQKIAGSPCTVPTMVPQGLLASPFGSTVSAQRER